MHTYTNGSLNETITFYLSCYMITGSSKVDGLGECGLVNPGTKVIKFASCALAAQDGDAFVSRRCRAQVKKLGKNLEIAITIPKCCRIADRPIGYFLWPVCVMYVVWVCLRFWFVLILL
ncbi:putative lipid-transfer protein DIR1 [Helianthus anomalus]